MANRVTASDYLRQQADIFREMEDRSQLSQEQELIARLLALKPHNTPESIEELRKSLRAAAHDVHGLKTEAEQHHWADELLRAALKRTPEAL